MREPSERARAFEAHRRHLLSVAYRMTGSYADAEDLVQDAYERWSRVDGPVDDPRALLTTIVSRLAIDHRRSARVRRERYVGPWLPEPVVGEGALSAEAETELAEDVSMALMLALERLSPLERAAFVLHDVFDLPHRRVASTLGRSEAACRKLAERARASIRAQGTRARVGPDEGQRIVRAFAEAVATGDLTRLSAMLVDDAVLYADSGGRVRAALRPIEGADRIGRYLIGVTRFSSQGLAIEPATVNGDPGILVFTGGRLDQVVSFRITEAGSIAAVYVVRNPEKLGHLASAVRPSL